MSNNKLPKRNELDPQFKWHLEDIYESNDLWEEDISRVRKLLEETVKFKGHIGDRAESLLRCLQLRDEMMSVHDKDFVYARMRRDEDNNNPLYQELTEKALSLNTEVNAALSLFCISKLLKPLFHGLSGVQHYHSHEHKRFVHVILY